MTKKFEGEPDRIVAESWHKVVAEAPRQYIIGQTVAKVLGGISATGSRVICFANETPSHVSAIIGDLDTQEATIAFGEQDYSQLIAEGPNLLDLQQTETTFKHLCERLRTC